MTEIEKLEQGIAALEAQRSILGDEVVQAATAPLREKMIALRASAATPAADRRKQITVMFADISRYTSLSETLDAEELLDTMKAVWQKLDAIITAQHGRIDKHMGDAVMALWGVNEAREDEAEQAVRAALALQAAVREFSEIHLRSIRLRIGINTGPVLLGSIGTTNEFTAIGDTVNLAARLEQVAPIGEILISHATYRQVRGLFDVQGQPPIAVKGKREPVQTYLVQSAKARAFYMITRGVEGVETHLIGRDAELAQIQNAFNACVQQRVTQALTLVGEAGLGKSRLVQEFFAWAELSPVTYRLFRGRATPSMASAPYALLRDLFAFRFEIQESDNLVTARAKLEHGLSALLPNAADAQEKAHFIGHLLGWDFSASPHVRGLLTDPLQIRTLALHFITLVFAAIAQDNPVVMLLDDLHWADQASLDTLRHIIGNLPPNTALLIIANARPTLFEKYPAWRMAAQTRIDLEPLTVNHCAALVTDILRNVPELPLELRDLIVRQADGNPFYVEELIKMLIDERIIEVGETEWRVSTERLSTLRVPPTLFGVVQARLDSLPIEERSLMQQASVMGRIFWDTAVQALSPIDLTLPMIHAQLDAAQNRELLFRHHSSAFADSREYRFKHALLRDVAYETVLKRDRPDYHARAARWLESIVGARRNEYLSMLAEHYEQAGQRDQAAKLWGEAGDRALALSAYGDAITFFKRALDLFGHTSSWWRALSEAHCGLSDFPAARHAIDQAQATANSQAERAAADSFLGEIFSLLGQYQEAQALLAEAATQARHTLDHKILCRALYALGDVYWRLGDLPKATESLQESLQLARKLTDITRELFAVNRLGTVALQHDLSEAERLFQEVYERAVQTGNRERAMVALNNLGVVADQRQQPTVQQKYMQQALALSREIGSLQSVALYLNNLASLDMRLRQFSEARQKLREALVLSLRLGTVPWSVVAVRNFGLLAYLEGQPDRMLALWNLTYHHPAWSSDSQRVLEADMAEYQIDPQLVEAGLAQEPTLNWAETIAELLK